jgi:inward rectifier potassium channel
MPDDRTRFPKVEALGSRLSFHEDAYHFILRLRWSTFLALVAAAFGVTNVIFALLYLSQTGAVSNASGFLDHFFFSVETLATIGYGVMAPQTRWAHAIVTMESLAGIAATAMITGLTFARFARPTSKILFSDKMVIATRDGVPHLMFRMANQRRNQIAEARLTVQLLITEVTAEGETMRRPMLLSLVRDNNPFFALSWTAMHRIDETSPFHGDGMQRLREQKAEFFMTVTGLDETLMQTIIGRWRYQLDEIHADHRFVDVLIMREDGTRVIDYDKFHEIVPAKKNL